MHRTVFSMIVLTACGFAAAQPPTTAPTPAEAMQQSGGSLLRASVGINPDPGQAKLAAVSFFAVAEPVPRTLKKHDLVTIIVREESEFKAESTADLKKQQDLQAKVDAFIKLNLENFAIEPQTFNNGIPEIKMSGQRTFKGEATVDRTDSLTLRVTAEVVDVKPNGTLVLQARKRLKNDEEEQEFILSGITRAEDVTPDNTVLSTQMFDIELSKTHKGAVRDTTKRGLLGKLLDVINPF